MQSGAARNNGRVLTISPLHLELYLKAAQQILDRAIVVGERPATIKWRFQFEEANSGRINHYRVNINGRRVYVNGGNNLFREGMTILRRDHLWDGFADVSGFKMPHAGYYTLRLRAAGVIPPEEVARQSGPSFPRRVSRTWSAGLPPRSSAVAAALSTRGTSG